MKKVYFSVLLALTALVVAGCATKSSNNSNDQNTTTGEQNRNRESQSPLNDNFAEASSTDLAVGQKIMAMGTDGDIGLTATMVLIGAADTSFDDFSFGGPPNGQSGQAPSDQAGQDGASNSDSSERPTPPEGISGERPDFGNMSDEERAQMMEKRQASGGAARGGANMAQQTKLIGEIIKQDAESITIKLDDGGSKLIYISKTTRVMKIK